MASGFYGNQEKLKIRLKSEFTLAKISLDMKISTCVVLVPYCYNKELWFEWNKFFISITKVHNGGFEVYRQKICQIV